MRRTKIAIKLRILEVWSMFLLSLDVFYRIPMFCKWTTEVLIKLGEKKASLFSPHRQNEVFSYYTAGVYQPCQTKVSKQAETPDHPATQYSRGWTSENSENSKELTYLLIRTRLSSVHWPGREKMYLMTCDTSKDSDQNVRSSSLIIVFARLSVDCKRFKTRYVHCTTKTLIRLHGDGNLLWNIISA